MNEMAEGITSGHGVASTIALRNKLRSIRQHVIAKSIDLASTFIPSLRHKFRFIPESELLLLICSIFPDDFEIPFDDLVMYMMGLGLFKDALAARSRVHYIISIFNTKKYSRKAVVTKSGLCHKNDGPDDQYAKMLDHARDLAKSVALNYPSVNEHSVRLECPKILLLHLQYKLDSENLPIDFFKGLKELLVLALDVPSLPQSLNVLWNLRTLHLKVTKFEDTSSIGGLFDRNSKGDWTTRESEVARLKKNEHCIFPARRIARLWKLEELYLPLNFKDWGCKAENSDDLDEFELEEQDGCGDEERSNADFSEIDDKVRVNASLCEIVSLSLNALQVCVPKASVLPNSSPLFKNLREFRIFKPNNVLCHPFGKYSVNVLQLTGDIFDIKERGICELLSRAEDLNLTQVQNLKNVICQLEDNGFPNLKKMIVAECYELEYIVDRTEKQIPSEGDHQFRKLESLHLSMLPNLKEICRERWRSLRWFSNLSQISIRFCPKLKYLFPLSIVEGLTLKRIEILECNEMEGMFYEDNEDDIPLALHSIENLHLYSLPWLNSLLIFKDNMNDEVCNDINKNLTANKGGSVSTCVEEDIGLPSTSTRSADVLESVTQQHHSSNQVLSIKDKNVVSHSKMHSLLPPKFVTKCFRNLKSLKIAYCDLVEVLFLFEGNHATSKAFNSLEVLELHGLRSLVHIWFQIPPKITAFKNLQLLVLSECHNLYLLSYRVAKLFVQLQKVCISRCEKMEEIITVKDEENEIKGRIALPRLKHLELQDLPSLRVLFGGFYEIELPSLESLKLKQCNKMESFSCGLTRMPMLEGMEVNGSFQLLSKDQNIIIKGVMVPHRFTFDDLKIATEDFSSDNILGEGGFGRVYKGWIDKRTFAPSRTSVGMPVAIKRYKSESKQGPNEWQTEMEILGSRLHSNLATFLGYCCESGEFFLVYEFIPRGRLFDHLFTRHLEVKPLSWNKRIKIAIGAAQGLNFLHTSDIIHRDIKVSNILLDIDYNSKVADFGLAIRGPSDGDVTTMTCSEKMSDLESADLRPVDGKCELASFVKGTIGYLDPAYYHSGRVSVKSDVYSFGVVLLELMTGLKTIDSNRPHKQMSLVDWLKPILSQERELRWWYMDSTMDGQYSSEAMCLMMDLILECLQEDRTMRPAMAEVLDKLLEIESIKQ